MKCWLDRPELMGDLRRSMDRLEPGWTETTFFCLPCRERHTLARAAHQRPMLRLPDQGAARSSSGRLPPIPPGAGEDYCRWHRTSSPALSAPCPYCGTAVHQHREALGKVRSGNAGQGFLEERCPACHRPVAIQPVHGKQAIRTSKLENGMPVLELTMRGVRS